MKGAASEEGTPSSRNKLGKEVKQLKESSSDWRMLSVGSGYAGCLRIRQGSVSSLGTWGFMCVGSLVDFNQRRDMIHLFLRDIPDAHGKWTVRGQW